VETVISHESVECSQEAVTVRNVNRAAKTQDVAAALGVTENTVQLYSRENRIPFDRTPGGHRRYDIAEVRAALDVGSTGSLLTPMSTPGLGTGATVPRSLTASIDAERRALVGEMIDDADVPEAPSAALALIVGSRRVLVAV